jgi:hypothetical protein
MRRYSENWLKASVAKAMIREAQFWEYWGKPANLSDRMAIDAGTADHLPSGTRLIFTRDVGHHSSGWLKNPDFERCLHLSLSFRDPLTGACLPRNVKLSEEWCELFFGNDIRKLSIEPPATPDGKAADVWHYRLFCTDHWLGIIPRGEVYSTELTERGWKSWSEIYGEEPEAVRTAG